jgi:uncharacterized membrane protein
MGEESSPPEESGPQGENSPPEDNGAPVAVSVEAFEALAKRVAELEQQVTRLSQQEPRAPYPLPQPIHPYPGPYPLVPGPMAPFPMGPPPGHEAPAAGPPRRPVEISSTVWIAGAGALIFLLGAGYFLYWSIERGILSPGARVALGVVTGAGMAAAAVRMMLGESKRLGLAIYLAGLGTLVFSIYYAAMVAELFAPTIGFGLATAAVVASAVIALRLDSEAILAVSYGVGLVAPLVFSTGSKAYEELAVYLLLLHVAGTVALHFARDGGSWHAPRLIGLFGTWLWLVVVALDARPDQSFSLLLLSAGTYLASIAWTLLPLRKDRPALVAGMWIYLHLGAMAAIWIDWARLELAPKGMGGVLLGVAAISAGLWPWARRRLLGSGDVALLLVAGACVVVAAPVLFELTTAYVLWSALALLAAAGTWLVPAPARMSAAIAASVMALVAVTGAAIAQVVRAPEANAVANSAFVSGILSTAAWLALLRHDPLRAPALAMGELTGHAVLAIEVIEIVERLGASPRVATIAATVLVALSAAVQYLASFRIAAPWPKYLSVASYALFGVVVLKLLMFDLQDTSTAVRALAALGIGVIFLGAALLANRLRRPTEQ